MRFSKKGDDGFTSLLGEQRVLKSDQRVETYGTLDEASSALGMARASAKGPRTLDLIMDIQKDLLLLGTELATLMGHQDKYGYCITENHVKRIEGWIDELQNDVTIGKEFILPGKTAAAAAIDLARTIIRRAERHAVRLRQQEAISNEEVFRYLNRLADLLFTLARYEEMHA